MCINTWFHVKYKDTVANCLQFFDRACSSFFGRVCSSYHVWNLALLQGSLHGYMFMCLFVLKPCPHWHYLLLLLCTTQRVISDDVLSNFLILVFCFGCEIEKFYIFFFWPATNMRLQISTVFTGRNKEKIAATIYIYRERERFARGCCFQASFPY